MAGHKKKCQVCVLSFFSGSPCLFQIYRLNFIDFFFGWASSLCGRRRGTIKNIKFAHHDLSSRDLLVFSNLLAKLYRFLFWVSVKFAWATAGHKRKMSSLYNFLLWIPLSFPENNKIQKKEHAIVFPHFSLHPWLLSLFLHWALGETGLVIPISSAKKPKKKKEDREFQHAIIFSYFPLCSWLLSGARRDGSRNTHI